ncbi:MAG: hypothetical protein ACR2GH_23230 [Pseudonocardia sp.]
MGLSNAWSVVLLVLDMAAGREMGAAELLAAGAAVWLTNVLAFALGYWELDRGGPAARAAAERSTPDFLFAQMQSPQFADADWELYFVDYLYLSCSPTPPRSAPLTCYRSVPVGQTDDDGPVRGGPHRRRARGRPCRQRPRVRALPAQLPVLPHDQSDDRDIEHGEKRQQDRAGLRRSGLQELLEDLSRSGR